MTVLTKGVVNGGVIREVVTYVEEAIERHITSRRIPRGAWGTVSAVVGQQCTFTQGSGSTPQTSVLALKPYVPTNGDTAFGIYVGTDFFLIGSK